MRTFLCIFASLAALAFARTEDSSPIPPPLNSVLRQIRPAMKKAEVAIVLSKVYPKVKAQGGTWSGQTGYVGFVLDERYSLHVSAQFDSKQEEVVHPDLLFYLFDNTKKLRVEIRQYAAVREYSWATNGKKG